MSVAITKHGSTHRLVVRGPFKGWLPDYPPDELPADAFSTANNLLVQRGRVQKIPGWSLWTNLAANQTVRAMGRYVTNAGAYQNMVVTNDKIWINTSGAFADSGAALAGSGPVDWTIHDNLWIMTNGSDKPYSYSGTGTPAAISTAQIARLCANYNDRLFLGYIISDANAGSADMPFRLRYSATGDPTDWTDAFIHDLISGAEPPEFSGLTALAPVGGSLACFKRNSIWRLDPLNYTPWYSAQQVVSGIGCIGLDAICTVPEGLIFVGETDVYFWPGAGAPQPMTAGLHNDMAQYIVPERYDKVSATWDPFNDRVLIGVASSGVNESVNRIYIFDRRESTWSAMTDPNDDRSSINFQAIGQMTFYDAMTIDEYMFMGSTTATFDGVGGVSDSRTLDSFVPIEQDRMVACDAAGNIFILWNDSAGDPVYARNAVAYTGAVYFGHLDWGRPDLVKRVQRIMPLNVTGGGLSHNLKMYLGTADNPYQTPTWGSAIDFPVNTTTLPWKYCDVKARYIVPRFETTGAAEPFELSGVVLDAVIQGEF